MTYAQPFPLAAPAQPKPTPPPQFGPDLAVRLICPDCRDPIPNIMEEFGSGDLVCGDCGLVLGDHIVDTRSEWRTFADDEGDDPSRVGAASDPLMEGMEQLDTIISFRDGGSGQARELQRAAARSQNAPSERNILSAFREISGLCDQFSLPKTTSDTAKQLYKRSYEEKILRGKPTEAAIATCIFVACRLANTPRTFQEIGRLTGVSKKVLGQCYKVLEQALSLSPGATAHQSSTTRASSGPENLLVRYCNYLDLPYNVQCICSDIIQAAREHGIAEGRNPVSIAGGAIYFTCQLFGKEKHVRDISAVAGVSESTIKLVYKIFYTEKEKLVKQQWIKNGKASFDNLH